MLPQWTYSEILDRLEALKSLLLKQKVENIPDRLLGMIANLRALEEASRERRTEQLFAPNDTASADRRMQELVWSLVEGQQLAQIYDAISNYDSPEVLTKQLLKALRGPLNPVDEIDSATNEGRNTLFELLLAAYFRRAGADITIGEKADLRVDYGGARVYVECKRPLRAKSIPTNVRKARQQLRERLDTDREAKEVGGLVAISISKALNSGRQWFNVEGETALQSLGDDIDRIRSLYPDYHNQQDDFRLVGMFYHLFTPGRVLSTQRLICASEIHLFVVKESMQDSFPTSGERLEQMLGNLRNPPR
jgi:hypothetical protein